MNSSLKERNDELTQYISVNRMIIYLEVKRP